MKSQPDRSASVKSTPTSFLFLNFLKRSVAMLKSTLSTLAESSSTWEKSTPRSLEPSKSVAKRPAPSRLQSESSHLNSLARLSLAFRNVADVKFELLIWASLISALSKHALCRSESTIRSPTHVRFRKSTFFSEHSTRLISSASRPASTALSKLQFRYSVPLFIRSKSWSALDIVRPSCMFMRFQGLHGATESTT